MWGAPVTIGEATERRKHQGTKGRRDGGTPLSALGCLAPGGDAGAQSWDDNCAKTGEGKVRGQVWWRVRGFGGGWRSLRAVGSEEHGDEGAEVRRHAGHGIQQISMEKVQVARVVGSFAWAFASSIVQKIMPQAITSTCSS